MPEAPYLDMHVPVTPFDVLMGGVLYAEKTISDLVWEIDFHANIEWGFILWQKPSKS